MKLGIHAAAVAFGCPEVASQLFRDIFEFFDLFFQAERNDEKVLLLEEIKNK